MNGTFLNRYDPLAPAFRRKLRKIKYNSRKNERCVKESIEKYKRYSQLCQKEHNATEKINDIEPVITEIESKLFIFSKYECSAYLLAVPKIVKRYSNLPTTLNDLILEFVSQTNEYVDLQIDIPGSFIDPVDRYLHIKQTKEHLEKRHKTVTNKMRKFQTEYHRISNMALVALTKSYKYDKKVYACVLVYLLNKITAPDVTTLVMEYIGGKKQ